MSHKHLNMKTRKQVQYRPRVIDKPTNIKNSDARKSTFKIISMKADIYRSSESSKLIFMIAYRRLIRIEKFWGKDGKVSAFEKFSLKFEVSFSE